MHGLGQVTLPFGEKFGGSKLNSLDRLCACELRSTAADHWLSVADRLSETACTTSGAVAVAALSRAGLTSCAWRDACTQG